MKVEVVVPQIGEAVSELTLTQWIKHAGDAVKAGDVLFEIDSDKAIVEVEAFIDGTLTEVLFGDGASVMPLQVVGTIETEAVAAVVPSEPTPAPTEQASAGNGAKASPVAERMAADLGIDLAKVSGTGPGGRITLDDVRRYDAQRSSPNQAHLAVRSQASPKARLLARQSEIDLSLVTGTGSGGMIITRDLERYTPSASVPALSAAPEIPSRMRQVIAQRMVASKQQVPHFYLMTDVNMTQAQALRKYCVDVLRWEKAPTYTDLLVRACALAIAAHPEVNRSFQDGIVVHDTINIGVAVNTDDGLVVPTLANADRKSLREVSLNVREMAARAREKRLRPVDLANKSLTISNLGMYRVDAFIAIIDMPDPMILAVGQVADRVVAIDKQVAIQPMCTLTLSVDHRVLDGAVAARVLESVAAILEAPFAILGDV
jgi:pyruvate dehydrogenase E2 component (dihydrolipoamide acetyltransferase)